MNCRQDWECRPVQPFRRIIPGTESRPGHTPQRPRRERSGGDEEGEFPDLGVAVVEVVGDECGLKGLGVAEEGLVVAEKG